MVLYLWGGPNNSDQNMCTVLEGDHKDNNHLDWRIETPLKWWLTSDQNKKKEAGATEFAFEDC